MRADVDWYRFDIEYDAVSDDDPNILRHLSAIFDVDYADGFARANTNLWVFDDFGQLVLIGGDSDTLDDRPISGEHLTDDLSRGSVGALDPFIGPVELPELQSAAGARRSYYVAISSNAQIPQEMQQYLVATPTNPLIRLEPVDSVNRIAEDRIADPYNYTTAEAPTVPVLFGVDDEVTLFVPDGSELKDGESFTLTNAAGNSMTYEFDADGQVTSGRVAIPFMFEDTAGEIEAQVVEVLYQNLPDPVNPQALLQGPTKDSPLIYSSLSVYDDGLGRVTMTEYVSVYTLLNEITTTDPFTNQLQTTTIERSSYRWQDPQVRQAPAPGEAEVTVYVSRPAVTDFTLGDVTMFVTQPGFVNRTELLSVDAFTGQQETSVGAFGAYVQDVAMHPRGALPAVGNGGGLFAYSIPQRYPYDDDRTGGYWQVNPSLNTPANLGEEIEDDGIETYEEDITDPGTEIRAGADEDGVGIRFNALTFSKEEVDNTVRGFAIGNRGDVYDLGGGQFISGAYGIPNPTNLLFEFNPNTGEAINPQGTMTRMTPNC